MLSVDRRIPVAATDHWIPLVTHVKATRKTRL